MPERLVGADPLLCALLQQLVGQVVGERDVVEDRPNVAQPLRPVERHLVRTVVGKTAHAGPHLEKVYFRLRLELLQHSTGWLCDKN